MNYREWRRRLAAMRLLRAFHYVIWIVFNAGIILAVIEMFNGQPAHFITGIFNTFWCMVLWLAIQSDNKQIYIWLTYEPE